MSCSKHQIKIKAGLRHNQLKATPARLQLLDLFEHAHQPLSAAQIAISLKKTGINSSTVYRNLESLVELGLLKKVSLLSRQVHYELSDSFSDRCHHHHLICLSCQKVVEISDCSIQFPSSSSLKKIGFSSIKDHSLEFFGLCNLCSRKNN